jgi:uncharacterized membrane protein
VNDAPEKAHAARDQSRDGFGPDFRRFFVRGLSAVLPTLITLWLVTWAWNFLWESMGRYVILAVQRVWLATGHADRWSPQFDSDMAWAWPDRYGQWAFGTKLIGVLVATVLVYLLGVLIGNFIGRTAYRLSEDAVMRLPFIRAIYPAVKQITDFLLAERSNQFEGSRVVAVRPHEDGIWSIGLITGNGLRPLSDRMQQEMVTVFVPSSPTAFSGYVLVVPRANVIDLPLTVEEALRMLVSGGVLTPADVKELPVSRSGNSSRLDTASAAESTVSRT